MKSGFFSHQFIGRKLIFSIAPLILLSIAELSAATVYVDGSASGANNGTSWADAYNDLQPAIDADVNIVPTAIQWRSKDPHIDIVEDVAYWKDHTLVPHFWRVLGLRGLSVEVSFAKPVPAAGADRKVLAKTAHGRVAKLLEERLGSH